MKKGLTVIIIGFIMLIIQALAIAKSLTNDGYIIPLVNGDFVYSSSYIIGYFLFGIIGLILLIVGINARKKSNS